MMPVGFRPIWFSPRDQRLQVGAADDRELAARLRRHRRTCAAPRVVSPFEKGAGCETAGVSVTRTVRLPCVTATVEICTSRPMTTVPVRSSMTTRAGVSGSTRQLADLGDEARRADLGRLLQRDRAEVPLVARPASRSGWRHRR